MIDQSEIPNLHDAELVSVQLDRASRTLTLGFFWPSSQESLVLKFSGVVAFRLSNFVLQNVISRAYYASSANIPEDEIRNHIIWANSLSDSDLLISSEALDRYVEEVKASAVTLFVMEPSWGAEGVVVFENTFQA